MTIQQPKNHQYPSLWLFFCAGMIFMMAVIGAITRLTESGLSMVEWQPLIGAIPPLNEAEWQRVFDAYRQTPEYQVKNAGMSMAAFKDIFFWEWFHRLWGRLIGLVFALPLLWFIVRGALRGSLLWRLLGLLALGGLQGFIGWFMVKSGLIDRPNVSHYRLAMHLSCALLLYSLCLWQGMALSRKPETSFVWPHRFRQAGWICLLLLCCTIIYGAFVAGLDAGQVYNTFPLMNGQFFPEDGLFLTPAWLNFLENHGTVQFTHRMLAFVTTAAIIAWAIKGMRIINTPRPTRRLFIGIKLMVCAQVGLGISAVLLHVPVWLGAIHQAGAIMLLTFLLCLLFDGRKCALSAAPDSVAD